MENEHILCPKCGSPQVMPVQKTYSPGCGCLGLLLFGWYGLLLGLLGCGDVEMVCGKCGARWRPGADRGYGCAAAALLIVILLLLFGVFVLTGAELLP